MAANAYSVFIVRFVFHRIVFIYNMVVLLARAVTFPRCLSACRCISRCTNLVISRINLLTCFHCVLSCPKADRTRSRSENVLYTFKCANVSRRQRFQTATAQSVLLPWRPFLSPDQCYTVGHWQKCWPRRRNPISVGVRRPNRVVRPASAPKTNNARRAARRKPAAVTVGARDVIVTSPCMTSVIGGVGMCRWARH